MTGNAPEWDAGRIFVGSGEMRERSRAFDWASTPLGPTARWRQSLRTAAATALGSGFPTILLWGPDLVQIYNDAYIPILGAKHPAALGMPTRSCWPEAWAFNEPIYARVRSGETVWLEDQPYRLHRRGPTAPPDDVHITLSYSPVPDESGAVGGVLVTLIDTTAEVAGRAAQAERDRLFRELSVERERLQEVIRQAPSFMSVVRGPDFVFETVNEAYLQLVGRRDLIGRPVFEVLPDARGQGFEDLLRGVLETGKSFVGHAMPLKLARAPGEPLEERYVDFVYMPLSDAEGRRTGVMAHGIDVTDHVLAERKVQRLLSESEQARAAAEHTNAQLLEQAMELELSNQQLQEQAVEMEAQAEELQAIATELEERTAEAQSGRVEADDARKVADAARRRVVDVFESITDPFFTVDPAWNFTYVNPAAEAVVGRPRASLIGRNLWDEFPEAVGTDYQRNAMIAVRERRPVDFEAYYPPPLDMWTAMRIYPLGTAAAPDGAAIYYQDVTARRRAEAALRTSELRLRDIFEQAPLAVAVLTGPDHVYSVVSPRYAASIGNRQAIGRPLREVIPEIEGQGVAELIDEVYRSGEPYFATERLVKIDRDGDREPEEYYFDIGYQPLRDADGVVYGVASVSLEVTAHVRARRELEVAREAAESARTEAEAANDAKSQFLSTMSHELRTPLNAIQGYTELLAMGLRGPVTDLQLEDFTRIRRASQHLIGLITDILDFARVDAGQTEYAIETVALAPILSDLEMLVTPQLGAKELTFTHDGCTAESPGPPHAVRADAEKVRQVLLNLLTNAIKFTERGGRIALSCEDDAASNVMRLHVVDTGRGIPADELERIFEPFVQVDRHRTHESQQGVGLGLAISRDLARGMGGDLTVTSTPGEGSRFTLVLPRG